MIVMIIIGVLLTVASYFAWAYIHEMSHILMAKRIVGLHGYKLRIFPHRNPITGFQWAGCLYWSKRQPTPNEEASISFAPRIPDVLAALALMNIQIFSGWPMLIWGIFWGAGVIDLIAGSIGRSEHSDLKKMSRGYEISAWWFRTFGFTLAIGSIIIALLYVLGGII